MSQCFFFFLIFAFFCHSFSSLPLLLDIFRPKYGPPNGVRGMHIYIYIYICMPACCVASACSIFWASAGPSYFEAILGGRDIFYTLPGVQVCTLCFCSRFGIETAKIGPRGRWDCRTERAGGHNVRFGVFLFSSGVQKLTRSGLNGVSERDF